MSHDGYTLSSKAARLVDWALDDLIAGHTQKGIERLCVLRGRPVPDLQTRAVALPVVGTLDVTPPLARPAVAEERDRERVVVQAKPLPRIVDVPLLDRFAATHRVCWVRGCGRLARRPHHIRKRSDHGHDVWENCFAACDEGPDNHHTGRWSWHSLQPYGAAFYVGFAPRLAREHRELIVAALPEIEPQVLGILNGSIAIYPKSARALLAA